MTYFTNNNTHNELSQTGGILGAPSSFQNPTWPPTINKTVIVQPTNDERVFIGVIIKHIWDNTATVLSLLNHKDYVEHVFARQGVIQGDHKGKGLFLLLPTYAWDYISEEMIFNLTEVYSAKDVEKYINSKIRVGYQKFMEEVSNTKGQTPLGTKTGAGLTSHVGVGVDIAVGTDVTQTPFHLSQIMGSVERQPIHVGLVEDVGNKKQPNCSGSAGIMRDTIVSEDSGPLLNRLFTDEEACANLDPNIQKQDDDNLASSDKRAILNNLLRMDKIPDTDLAFAGSETLSIGKLITTKEEEEIQSEQIKKWITDRFKDSVSGQPLFTGLQMRRCNGYLHIYRGGIEPVDRITEQLVNQPLQYFDWQIGKPIDYHILKRFIVNNDFQESLIKDRKMFDEATNILSQEYLITLQPEPVYQMWCLKRLIMAWFADEDLNKGIRKIKVLINQWRAKSGESFNKRHGVLPSILVYPRYGFDNIKTVWSKLKLYFATYDNIGWKCSGPSYFVKISDLFYYSNGAIDLKIYFRHLVNKSKGSLKNYTFTDKFDRLIKGKDPFDVAEISNDDIIGKAIEMCNDKKEYQCLRPQILVLSKMYQEDPAFANTLFRNDEQYQLAIQKFVNRSVNPQVDTNCIRCLYESYKTLATSSTPK